MYGVNLLQCQCHLHQYASKSLWVREMHLILYTGLNHLVKVYFSKYCKQRSPYTTATRVVTANRRATCPLAAPPFHPQPCTVSNDH